MTRVLLVPDLPLERWPSMDRYAHRLHDWLESTDPGFEVRLAASGPRSTRPAAPRIPDRCSPASRAAGGRSDPSRASARGGDRGRGGRGSCGDATLYDATSYESPRGTRV